jgi:hypothetical protein
MQPTDLETRSKRIIFGIIGIPVIICMIIFSIQCVGVGIVIAYDGKIKSILLGILIGIITQIPLVVIIGTWLRMIKKYESMSTNMIKFVRSCFVFGVALCILGGVVCLCAALATHLNLIQAEKRLVEVALISSVPFILMAYIFGFLLLKGTPKVH